MIKLIQNDVGGMFEEVKARGEKPELPIVSIPDLNRKIWGLHKKKLTVIAARTSNGKSALAIQLAWDIASQGKKVLFLSLEMYKNDVYERLFCQLMRVDNYHLLTGRMGEYKAQEEAFMEKIKKVPLVVTDMVGKTWQDLDEYISKIGSKPDVIFIDHVQEAKDASQFNKAAVIEEYLKNLRVMAIHHNFAAVVLSQVNRASQEDDHKEPQLHHLKGTGYLEEGADVIMLLHWPYLYTKKGENNRFIIRVAKNRNGRTGLIQVVYTPQFYLFEEYVAPAKPAETVKEKKQEPVNWQDTE